jgi:uncharacterized protein (TIGR03067 family)
MGKRGKADQAQAQPAFGRLEDSWDEPRPALVASRPDEEMLQGAWTCTSGRRRASFLVCGNLFAIHFIDGDIYMGSFVLDPVASPRTMVVTIHEGPSRHRGLSAHCIYELEGDTMRWCTAGPDRTGAPAAFPPEGDPNYLCLVLQRHRA